MIIDFVMAGHNPSKTGVDALLSPAIHVFDIAARHGWLRQARA